MFYLYKTFNKKIRTPASEYSSPSGRPLSCVVDENTPVMTPVNGAEASGPPGEHRIQERRVRSQRHRNYMSRTHLHTPPDLPEGYEQGATQQRPGLPPHTQTESAPGMTHSCRESQGRCAVNLVTYTALSGSTPHFINKTILLHGAIGLMFCFAVLMGTTP
ncbi:E3 ubiquitin-protein ligase SMURF2-like protein [Lates japonicus]|uniref:E3 ubiquitin-protein ligase SMURF2-like protein n=1 Tax=Lates japonicus TaxID=270547 RepID=A0AAD3RMN5_LATJO|nr:E3 ubiquitin-protein ligase SMURF2-like protein [Lates japonicus]